MAMWSSSYFSLLDQLGSLHPEVPQVRHLRCHVHRHPAHILQVLCRLFLVRGRVWARFLHSVAKQGN